jgi:hypothetical protein
LPEGGQSCGCRGVAVVPSGDRDGTGHAAAGPGRGAERAEGEFVAHRGDRVGRVVAAEHLVGDGLAVRGGVARAHGDPQAGRGASGFAESSRGEAFHRDAPTLLSYGVLAGYAFWLYAFGPALALLQAELHFSYTLIGVYSALWSAGAVLVGASFAGLTAAGLRAAQAATAMSGFYLGILGGRVGGVWLTRRAGRTIPLLWASLAITAAGFGLFWLAGLPAPAIAGLFLCGVGIANLYPLSLALTLAAAPGNGDTANARTQLIGGVLVITAPYLLGSLADHLGLHVAFTVEPVLIGACALLLLAGLRLRGRRR